MAAGGLINFVLLYGSLQLDRQHIERALFCTSLAAGHLYDDGGPI